MGLVLSSHTDHVTTLSVSVGDIVFLRVEVEQGVWAIVHKNMEGEIPVQSMEVTGVRGGE